MQHFYTELYCSYLLTSSSTCWDPKQSIFSLSLSPTILCLYYDQQSDTWESTIQQKPEKSFVLFWITNSYRDPLFSERHPKRIKQDRFHASTAVNSTMDTQVDRYLSMSDQIYDPIMFYTWFITSDTTYCTVVWLCQFNTIWLCSGRPIYAHRQTGSARFDWWAMFSNEKICFYSFVHWIELKLTWCYFYAIHNKNSCKCLYLIEITANLQLRIMKTNDRVENDLVPKCKCFLIFLFISYIVH